MFKKIRRAFIKICNKRSIDILDMTIKYHKDFLKLYKKEFEENYDNNMVRSIYYRHAYIIDALRECKQQITCEKELEL